MGVEVDDRRERFVVAETQYQASSTIYGSSDPVEILNALINFGGKGYADAHLGLLDPETQVLDVIAARDEQGVHTTQAKRRLDDYPAWETLSAVEALYIPDVDADPFLTEAERSRVKARGIGAMLLIPLVVAQRLTGLISFTNPAPVEISSYRLRAMRNLGDQIAVVFENQALLRSTAGSLDEVQTLYNINRAMLGALDPLDMLHVLRSHLAQDAHTITHAVVERSPETGTETLVIRHVSRPIAEEVVETPLPMLGKPDEVFGTAESTTVEFLEDIDKSGQRSLARDVLKADHVGSYVAILVRERGSIRDLIAVTYDHPQVFDSRTRRLFDAVADQIGIVLQNQRLLRSAQATAQQLEQQVRLLQSLNQLSSEIGTLRSEKELLDYASKSLVTTLGVDHVGIVLFEQREYLGTVISEYPDHGAIGSKIETRNSAMVNSLRRTPDHPVIIQDMGTDPLIEPETREVLNRIGVISMMIMALQSSGKIVGTVGFDLYNRERQITRTMIETAETMVAQIAIGLENRRLLIDAQRRAAQLQRVATFGQSLQTTLKLDTVLSLMLSESPQLLPIDRMSIAFFDARAGKLRVAAQYEDEKISVDLENGALLAMTGTFVGQVWETQEIVAIADTQEASSVSDAADISLRSLMVAPIRSRGRVLGTVNIGSFSPYSYADTDQAIFQQMINQLAVAIENAEAYRQSQHTAQNEALINDIATHFQQHSAVEDMLQIAVDELGRALGARRARIRLSMQPDGENGR